MLKLAPILKEISKDFRMGGHDGSGGHDGKLHQAFTLVMEWEAVEYLKVSRWDQKSQITTVEYIICINFAPTGRVSLCLPLLASRCSLRKCAPAQLRRMPRPWSAASLPGSPT